MSDQKPQRNLRQEQELQMEINQYFGASPEHIAKVDKLFSKPVISTQMHSGKTQKAMKPYETDEEVLNNIPEEDIPLAAKSLVDLIKKKS